MGVPFPLVHSDTPLWDGRRVLNRHLESNKSNNLFLAVFDGVFDLL